jgi:sugar phosphate permease
VPLAFGLSGVGLVGMGLASSVPLVVVFAVIAGFGNGLILPSLLTWALGPLTFEQRGRGTGVWTSAFFIGQFVCPLVVLALTGAFSLGAAILVLGVVSVAAAVGVRLSRPTQAAEPALAAH